MKLFGRDPALLWQAVAVLLALIGTFWLPLNDTWQTWINGLIVAAWGVVTAVTVAKEKIVPAVAGLVQAVALIAGGLGFGVSPQQQFLFITFFGLLFAFLTRTQVVAPVAIDGSRVVNSTVVTRGTNVLVEPVNPNPPPSGV